MADTSNENMVRLTHFGENTAYKGYFVFSAISLVTAIVLIFVLRDTAAVLTGVIVSVISLLLGLYRRYAYSIKIKRRNDLISKGKKYFGTVYKVDSIIKKEKTKDSNGKETVKEKYHYYITAEYETGKNKYGGSVCEYCREEVPYKPNDIMGKKCIVYVYKKDKRIDEIEDLKENKGMTAMVIFILIILVGIAVGYFMNKGK